MPEQTCGNVLDTPYIICNSNLNAHSSCLYSYLASRCVRYVIDDTLIELLKYETNVNIST